MKDQINTMQDKPRLYFIDMARTCAILLMLEGHFVYDTLDPIWANPTYPAYNIWAFIRGFTSPTFLTVTGMIFTYLLLGNEHTKFGENLRIRKGFKRVAELLFWGYVLQADTFHVLQCIAFGILTIILIYGLYRVVRVIPLWIYYFIAGILLFYSFTVLEKLDTNYWPINAPSFIQNMFYSPTSIFPITPNMGYTMFGAMLGTFLFRYKTQIKNNGVILGSALIGLLVFFGIKSFFKWFHSIELFQQTNIHRMYWLFENLGMVVIVLATLLAFETYVISIKKNNLFLKIGQNTLSIFVIHIILLYGKIFGIGINSFLHKNLGPWEIIPYTLGFWLIFIIFIYYIDFIRQKLKFILWPMKKYSNWLFGIKV